MTTGAASAGTLLVRGDGAFDASVITTCGGESGGDGGSGGNVGELWADRREGVGGRGTVEASLRMLS